MNQNMKMPRRVDAQCVECREWKEPVAALMEADGFSPETYVCMKCRALEARMQEKEHIRQIKLGRLGRTA